MTSPADGPLGDSAIVLDDGIGPGPEPERRPARRPRRAPRPRAVRRAAPPVLGRDLVPDRLRLPARREGPPRAQQARRRDGPGPALRRGGRRDARVPVRGPAVLPRPRPRSRSTTSTATPRTSSPTRRVFLDRLADARHRSRPSRRARIGRRRSSGDSCTVTHPDRRRDAPRRSTTSAPTSSATARLGRTGSSESGRVGRRPASTSSARSPPGSNRCSSARRSRRPASPGNVVIDVGDPDANLCIDFVESQVRVVARRPVGLQGRRRPRA